MSNDCTAYIYKIIKTKYYLYCLCLYTQLIIVMDSGQTYNYIVFFWDMITI